MIYISDTDPDQYFTASGHDGAHAADAAELYTLIDRLTDRTGWDAIEEEAYQELGRLCGYLEVNDYDGYDAFMDACKAVIEKEKANG